MNAFPKEHSHINKDATNDKEKSYLTYFAYKMILCLPLSISPLSSLSPPKKKPYDFCIIRTKETRKQNIQKEIRLKNV